MTNLISNPPYNMKWNLPPFAQIQPRFCECELPPESNANYAFILTALDKIDGKACFILPCGVLSTDNKQEKEIRKYLVEKNYIDSVITCPDGMFESTTIPTCLINFDKNKSTTQITFVDMRQTYEVEEREQRGQYGGKSHENRVYKKQVKIFSQDNINKTIEAITERKNEPEFCKTTFIDDVRDNDYILIPSRYIEFQEKQSVHRPYNEIVNDINRVTRDKNACKLTINESLAKALGFNIDLYKSDQNTSDLNELLKKLGAEPLEKSDYFKTSKNKNEIKFENNSKDILSSVLMMILSTWKQHICYLNQEENRYLAELRDAMLPDLMSGKIEI